MSKLVANLIGGLLVVLLCAGFIELARLLPHYTSSVDASHALATLVTIVSLIVVHEALHAVGMVRFGKVSWHDIRFGFTWRALMPYCHCTVPLSIHAYRLMGLLPLWTTGAVTLALLLVFPSDWLGLITGVTLAACVGDVWLVAKLRRFPKDWLVQDSPSEIGCDVSPPVKAIVA